MLAPLKSGILALLLLSLSVLFCAPAFAGGGGAEGELGLVGSVGLTVVMAAVVAVIFHRLRLPPLLAYTVGGLLLQRVASHLLAGSMHTLEEIAHLGLVFLLFIIGLELDLRGILKLGTRTAVAILSQAPIAFGFVLGLQYLSSELGWRWPGLGESPGSWAYFGVAAALGSTAVVVKLLGDNHDLGSRAGSISVLTLIGEDIWAVLALSYLASQGAESETGSLGVMLGGGVALTAGLVLGARLVLKPALASVSRSPELLVLVALGWCFLSAEGFAMLGLSAEMGALIAGLTLGPLPQSHEVMAQVSSLRDFFMALFFVSLGISLPTPTAEILLNAGALALLVMVVRVGLYAPALITAGLGKQVSLTSSIQLAQLSEFSLLLLPIGVAQGVLGPDEAPVIAYALLLSVVVSTFTLPRSHVLAQNALRLLGSKTDSQPKTPAAPAHEGSHHDLVLLGFHYQAEALVQRLQREAPEILPRTLVLDYNLQNHDRLKAMGLQVHYADISRPETLRMQGLEQSKVVICTLSDIFLRGIQMEELIRTVKSIQPEAIFLGTTYHPEEIETLESQGARRMICPPQEATGAYMDIILSELGAELSASKD